MDRNERSCNAAASASGTAPTRIAAISHVEKRKYFGAHSGSEICFKPYPYCTSRECTDRGHRGTRRHFGGLRKSGQFSVRTHVRKMRQNLKENRGMSGDLKSDSRKLAWARGCHSQHAERIGILCRKSKTELFTLHHSANFR